MTQFDNVSIIKTANIYFDGKVTSRTVLFTDGTRKTLGIMLPGDYEFGTGDAEIMEITAGEVLVLLPGKTEWEKVTGGQTFNVPANSRFKIQVQTVSDYCCSYIKA